MNKLEQRLGSEVSKLSGMELDARRLPLTLPRVSIGVEYSIAEQVANVTEKELSLWEVGELGLEEVLQITRVAGDDGVETAERGALENEGPVLTAEDGGDPLIRVGPYAGH